MRHAWTPKFQLSGPTVHSYTVPGSKLFLPRNEVGLLLSKFWDVAQYINVRVI